MINAECCLLSVIQCYLNFHGLQKKDLFDIKMNTPNLLIF